MFYGANCSSHHVLSFSTGVNCLSHPIVYDATVQATIIVSSFTGITCLGHPIFYGANCSSHHVISLSQMLIVWATLFRPVITVQATMLLLVMRASATPFWWCQLLEPLWYSFPQRWSMFWALQYYLFHCRFIIIIRSSS